MPEEPLSLEHLLDIAGVVTVVYGVTKVAKGIAAKSGKAAKAKGGKGKPSFEGGSGALNANTFKTNARNKLNSIRSQMPNNPLKNKGNMAIADVDIPGLKKEFVAHSKINNPADKGVELADFSILKLEKDRIFKTYEQAAPTFDGIKFDRYHDTETKILEDIASQIADPNISGSINLYTELNACQSCTNVIFELKRMILNIKLNISNEQ